MAPSIILIWSKETGFVRVTEGSGDNLLNEDLIEGYVDYINIDGLEFNGFDCFDDSDDVIEGGMAMMRRMYQEQFRKAKDVIDYLIYEDFLPRVEYAILYEE